MSAPTPQNIVWDDDLSNPVYLDNDLGQPWPNNPQPTWERTATRHKMLSEWDPDEDVTIPGKTTVVDLGYDISDGEVTLVIPLLPFEKVEALRAKSDATKPVRWTPDGGATIYRCALQGGTSFKPEPIPRLPGWFRLTMALWIMSRAITGS